MVMPGLITEALKQVDSVVSCFDLETPKGETNARHMGKEVLEVKAVLKGRGERRYLIVLIGREATGAVIMLARGEDELPMMVEKMHERSEEIGGLTAWVCLPEELNNKVRPVLEKIQKNGMESIKPSR